MLILGWHGGWRNPHDAGSADAWAREAVGHDASAVLLDDGRIVAAIEEERLRRIKHTTAFPAEAIRFCLRQAGARLQDVQAIATDASERFLDHWVMRRRLFESAEFAASGRDHIAALFQREFDVDVHERLHFCGHHLAHTYACWYGCGYESALSVCFDAAGDGPAGLVALGGPQGLTPLRHVPLQQSLGYFYVRCIALLGYRLFDEYKVMGLAPYGDPAVYRNVLSRMYALSAGGRFTLATDDERVAALEEAGLMPSIRRRGTPFTEVHRNFAASLQEALERIVMHVVRHFREETGADSLCLTGGVAHNCSANGQLLRSGLFRRVYVHPAAHDAGNALGAAFSAARASNERFKPASLAHVYLGSDVGASEQIAAQLLRWQPLITIRHLDDAEAEAARLIAAGKVIAWVQGRSEFGPRALGNRSILADPRPARNKRVINEMVKKREGYRPFAPSVLEERLHDFFEAPATVTSLPFMTFVLFVRQDKRELLGAVTHVDGTARVQTVSRQDNAGYHRLIAEFAALTGVPIVLNTSFNNDAEPIVESVDDAVATYLCTGLAHLIVGDWLVSKLDEVALPAACLDLVPSLAPGRTLIMPAAAAAATSAFLEMDGSVSVSRARTPVSPALVKLLLDDGDDSCAARCARHGIVAASLVPELYAAWQARAIRLQPAGSQHLEIS